MADCIFCEVSEERITLRNDLAIAIRDAFPVVDHHSLVIPRRHVDEYFALTEGEILACDQLLRQLRERLTADDPSIKGFNVGVNIGSAAGQTIFHCRRLVVGI